MRRSAVFLLLVFLVGACGPSHPGRLDDGDYLARVDGICKGYDEQFQVIPTPDEHDTAGVARYVRAYADLVSRQADDMDRVGRPRTREATVDSLLARQRALVTALRAEGDAYDSRDPAQMTATRNAVYRQLTDLNNAFRAFGFGECGKR